MVPVTNFVVGLVKGILSISISRDNTNVEYLEVLRSAYMKKKDYENAERIYQMILNLQ